MVDPRKMAPQKQSIRQRDWGVEVLQGAGPMAGALYLPAESLGDGGAHILTFDAPTQVVLGKQIYRTWLPDGEVEGSTVHELAGEVRRSGYYAVSHVEDDGRKVLTWWGRATTSPEPRSHEPIRRYHEVDPVRWDKTVRAASDPCSLEGSVAHSPSGPCPKCEWPYCRVPRVRRRRGDAVTVYLVREVGAGEFEWEPAHGCSADALDAEPAAPSTCDRWIPGQPPLVSCVAPVDHGGPCDGQAENRGQIDSVKFVYELYNEVRKRLEVAEGGLSAMRAELDDMRDRCARATSRAEGAESGEVALCCLLKSRDAELTTLKAAREVGVAQVAALDGELKRELAARAKEQELFRGEVEAYNRVREKLSKADWDLANVDAARRALEGELADTRTIHHRLIAELKAAIARAPAAPPTPSRRCLVPILPGSGARCNGAVGPDGVCISAYLHLGLPASRPTCISAYHHRPCPEDGCGGEVLDGGKCSVSDWHSFGIRSRGLPRTCGACSAGGATGTLVGLDGYCLSDYRHCRPGDSA